MFPIWKLNIFICGFSTKVTPAYLASETMEKSPSTQMLLYAPANIVLKTVKSFNIKRTLIIILI